jgi:TolB-like protein/tetratricopeptide (TPR) repeat protein
LQHIADAVLEIRETLNLPATAPPVTIPVKSRRMTMAVGAAIIIALSCVAVWYAFHRAARQIGIVVLPFDSQGPIEDEYFADGITEGIRSHLLGIDRLRVICRTSAIEFKQSKKTVQQVADDLNVAYVLMGTVRWEPSPNEPTRVHVTPEMIKASDASLRWSDSYPGALSSSHFLGVQSKIAREVVRALDITLSDEQRRAIQARPTHSIEAWNHYVRGNDFELHGYQDRDNVLGAIDMHGTAVDLDPGFAAAHAKLSKAHSAMYAWHGHSEDHRIRASNAIERALEIDRDLAEALWAKGWYHYWCLNEYEPALELFKRAQEGKPDDSQLIAATAYAQRRMGRFEDALSTIKKAYEADPLSRTITAELGSTFMIMRNYGEAAKHLQQAVTLAPAFEFPYRKKAQLYLLSEGNIGAAREVLNDALTNVPLKNQRTIRYLLVDIDTYDGDYDGALERLNSFVDPNYMSFQDTLHHARIRRYMQDPVAEKEYYKRALGYMENILSRSKPADAGRLSLLYSCLGIAYAGLDRKVESIEAGKKGVAVIRKASNARAVLKREEDLARIYVMVGDPDSAIDIVKDLLGKPGELSLPLLEIDPDWAPLRRHARYSEISGTIK